MEKDANIYVAGHRGLVGAAILRKLQAEGYTSLITRSHSELDLTRQESVEKFFNKESPDYVLLAAAEVGGILANNTYPADFIYNNLVIQTNIIRASYANNVKKLLFLGSSCIYPKHCPQPMKEEYLLSGYLEPTNEAYAIAKIAGIKMCQSYNRQYGTRYISLMPTNLYGPNDNFDLETSHVLAALIRKFHITKLAAKHDWKAIRKDVARFGPVPDAIKSNKTNQIEVTIWGTGEAKREFLHVDDLADACVYLMNKYDSSEIINVGTGEDLKIKELAEMIKGITEFNGPLVFDKSKPDGTLRKLLDVSRINAIGWAPKINLENGIRYTYEWYKSVSESQ